MVNDRLRAVASIRESGAQALVDFRVERG